MATLQYVGIDTSLYTSQTAVPPDSLDSDDNRSPEDRLSNDCDNDESIVQLDDGVDVTPNDSEPLLFFYECETTGGSYHQDHIIEVAATVVVPDGLHITSTQFPVYTIHLATLPGKVINTYVPLMHHFFLPVSKKCGITPYMLYNQPMFSTVLQKLLQWISSCVGEAEQQKSSSHHPGMA